MCVCGCFQGKRRPGSTFFGRHGRGREGGGRGFGTVVVCVLQQRRGGNKLTSFFTRSDMAGGEGKIERGETTLPTFSFGTYFF